MNRIRIQNLPTVFLLVGALGLFACNSGGGGGEESAEASGAESPEESPTATPPDEAPEVHRVWVGLNCDVPEGDGSPNAMREFSFYVDGSEMQRLETACAPAVDGAPPNGGQFAMEVEAGERVLRIQDDTGDAHTEETIYVRSDTWLTVNHRVLAEGQGFLTTVDAATTAPPFDMTEETVEP